MPPSMFAKTGCGTAFRQTGVLTGFDVEHVVPFGVETGEPARVTGIFHPAGSEFRVAKATSADISLFGIEYQGKSGISSSQFSWAA